MIKRFLIVNLILLPLMGLAQSKAPAVMLQMRNGRVYFDDVYSLRADIKKETLHNRALSWLQTAFKDSVKNTLVSDEKKGEVDGTGICKIITSNNGHYYWLRFAVSITVHDATYEVKLFDFYEKPIEPGISNEYSKIEYRWWDYRQGKPWSAEDKTLFEGMAMNINETLQSLEKAMNP